MLRCLRSRGLALTLLVLISTAVVAGTLLPQRALTAPREYDEWTAAHPLGATLAEALSLTQVYQSWWFLVLLGLLLLSLLTCTVNRSRQVMKLDRVRHLEGRAPAPWVRMEGHHLTVPLTTGNETKALAGAAAVLRTAGFTLRTPLGAERVFAEKGRWGVWGVTVLHLSIMVILLGGVWSGAGKTAGYVELGEGQAFSDRPDDYLHLDKGLLAGNQHTGFQFRLDRLQTEYWDNGDLRQMTSAITLLSRQGERQQAEVGVDQPLAYQGATLYQARQHGFATLLVLKDLQRGVVASGYVNFATPKDPTQASNNRFPVPWTGLRADADFYPAPGPGPVTPTAWKQEHPEQPWLYLFLRDERGQTVFQGPLTLGEEAPAGAYWLRFERVARWAGFPVVRDPGIPVIYAGFALGVMGAVLTYLWIPKRVWVWVKTTGEGQRQLCLGGRADKFEPAFSEELRELRGRMERGLGGA